jgi:hypothetical protein
MIYTYVYFFQVFYSDSDILHLLFQRSFTVQLLLVVGALGYVYVHYLFATSAGNLKMVSVSSTDASQADESKRLVRVCSVKASVVGGVGRNGENESKRPVSVCKG